MMSEPSAFQLEQALSTLLSVRERLLAEDPDIVHDERLMLDMLEGEGGNAMDVLNGVIRATLHAESMEKAAKERAATLVDRAGRYARRAEALRGAVFAAMDALRLKRIERDDFTASIAAGVPSVIITDETVLPAEYQRIKVEPDKAQISAALKAGKSVPGAELSNSLPRLTIRTR